MIPGSKDLTAQDLAALKESFITPELARQASLVRVDSFYGAHLVGRNGGADYSGIVFPNLLPGALEPRQFRLRRDRPELEKKADGSLKEKAKYLSPPGSPNLLYFVPGTSADWLRDTNLPIAITEGEKKTIALFHLALYSQETTPRFLAVGIPGVWNWRGKVGKARDQSSASRDVKGVIPDLDRVTWNGRIVYIIFDANVTTNVGVSLARSELAAELVRRGSQVRLVDLPTGEGINGVDDLLASQGEAFVLGLIAGARLFSYARAERVSQASKIVSLVKNAELFSTAEGEPYASFEVNGHLQTWAIRSPSFREYLTHTFYRAEQKVPAAQGVQEALASLKAQARFDGETHEVHVRIAEHDEVIYVDLGDDDWRIVRISADACSVIKSNDSPVKFRRTKGMRALPLPKWNVHINVLRGFLNITDSQWPLMLGWLVGAFRPGRPLPVLALHGEQGTAKSTNSRVLRRLIDPNKTELRNEPRDERDLMIAATNSWVLAFDNFSQISPWLSDALCRLVTGAGFATRKLFEDDEEILFAAKRPMMLNGIGELAVRSDLLDRSLLLGLPTIAEQNRRSEADFWSEFEGARAGIFGALLNAVSYALRNINDVRIIALPRMADFALWATAAEAGLGLPAGAVMSAYNLNREFANEMGLDASPLSAAIMTFLESKGTWTGKASEMLSELNAQFRDGVKKPHGWPKSANSLGGELKRLAPNLRVVGIKAAQGSGRERRTWTLEKLDKSLSPSSHLAPHN